MSRRPFRDEVCSFSPCRSCRADARRRGRVRGGRFAGFGAWRRSSHRRTGCCPCSPRVMTAPAGAQIAERGQRNCGNAQPPRRCVDKVHGARREWVMSNAVHSISMVMSLASSATQQCPSVSRSKYSAVPEQFASEESTLSCGSCRVTAQPGRRLVPFESSIFFRAPCVRPGSLHAACC